MRAFAYERAVSTGEALAAAVRRGADPGQPQARAPVQYYAGGTVLLDLMKLGAMRPEAVIDINGLAREHGAIDVDAAGLQLGSLVRMSDAAAHPAIRRDYPVIAQALELAASPQLRNMASLAGNVLQRTRCPYFRDPSWARCNKRTPGSGCAARDGVNRRLAVLGVSEQCIASYPGDLANALVALDAEVDLIAPDGTSRTLSVEKLHRLPGTTPHLETELKSGELITAFRVPARPWFRRSLYLKIRDRESYDFALASAAVALDLDGDTVREARIALGGLAATPWRARAAEAELKDRRLDDAAAERAAQAALRGAVPHGNAAFKCDLGRRTVVRALLTAAAMDIGNG